MNQGTCTAGRYLTPRSYVRKKEADVPKEEIHRRRRRRKSTRNSFQY